MDFLFPKDFLDRYGADCRPWSPTEARAYTRWLSGAHYENFHVVSFLLPKSLHQDFFNVYAYCRWADDLGDELGDRRKSLVALAWWRGELESLFGGRPPRHPVFVALQETVARRRLPEEPFERLIQAFEMDQTKTRYQTYEEVLDYCVYSANPVGRLVLGLCGYSDERRVALSDSICTALQLANHWQDVRRDLLERDRVYLPADRMAAHGYDYGALARDVEAGRAGEPVRALIRDLTERALALFEAGADLPDLLDRRLSIDIELFRRGGITVLDKIRRQGYDVISRRPKVGKLERVGLVVRVLASRLLAGRNPSGAAPRPEAAE
ncbi:MAG: squalene synthase HpnC [Acidobacteria bacterium]|nr:squalene synthase HpnC [Acidobacteriota bacterium]